MKFEEALQAMREGKKVRCGKCTCAFHIGIGGNRILDADNDPVSLYSSRLMSEDWEIVE